MSSELSHPTARAEALREAFRSEGISPATVTLLLRALDAGLDWEWATNGVAHGLAERHRTWVGPLPPRRTPPASAARWPEWMSPLAAALGAYAVLRPMIGLGHQLAIAGLALLAHAVVASDGWIPLIGVLRLDPVYAGAAVRAAGGVRVLGFAVAEPLGTWLHRFWPAMCRAPEQVMPGAAVSMVAQQGTPALGRGLAAFGADVLWLAVGIALFWTWRHRARWLSLLGLLLQAQVVVNHLLDAQVSLADLDASGLPFALSLATTGPANNVWITGLARQLPPAWQDVVLGGVLLVAGYTSAVLLILLWAGASRLARRLLRLRNQAQPATSSRLSLPLAGLGAATAVMVAISPIGDLAAGAPNWQAGQTVSMTGGLASGAAGRVHHVLQHPELVGSSTVRVEQVSDGSWRYVVNGQPTVVRGVGYNPQYASLSTSERERLYQRDFSAMRELGINTVEGWFEPQFDDLTLDYAARNGLGVIMPFEINQDWDLTNPNVRQSILDHVSAWVDRYKDRPAVRMWAPGNENIHRILYPRWVSQENEPAARARADAFAAFLPVLVDRIHQLDPNHPVLYRDAEDVYLRSLKTALEANGGPRPWLLYGANVYSPTRLKQIVDAWPSQWLAGPLLISEFAPGGVGPTERPLGFEQEWAIIRSRPDIILGGLAYTWATNGPEELDRVFGLVDANGVPTDGALAALSAAYLGSN